MTESRWFQRRVIYIRARKLKPQKSWEEVQFASGMGQHHQEEREGKEAKELNIVDIVGGIVRAMTMS